MSEYVTRAIVLGFKNSKEHDKIFDFYTEDLGRVRVRAPGGKKIVSKLSPHLDTCNLATVKIVEKNALTLTDAVVEDDFRASKGKEGFFAKALRAASVLRAISPEAVPDPALWNLFVHSLQSGAFDLVALISVLGYDPRHASCTWCGASDIAFFNEGSQEFLCESCGSKINENNLLYLK